MKEQIEKQAIEEMAKIISQHTVRNCEEVPFNNTKKMVDGFCVANVPSCGSCKAARALTKAGYRKQSEGEWIAFPINNYDGEPSGLYYVCSNCHTDNGYEDKPYCPNCGAKMKGE